MLKRLMPHLFPGMPIIQDIIWNVTRSIVGDAARVVFEDRRSRDLLVFYFSLGLIDQSRQFTQVFLLRREFVELCPQQDNLVSPVCSGN